MNLTNKKEVFSEIRDCIYLKSLNADLNDVKLSILKNSQIINEIKTLQVIELDDLKDFNSYINYDHYLIFKLNNDYYFCDTELYPSLREYCMIKVNDFNQHFRKEKMEKISCISNENKISS